MHLWAHPARPVMVHSVQTFHHTRAIAISRFTFNVCVACTTLVPVPQYDKFELRELHRKRIMHIVCASASWCSRSQDYLNFIHGTSQKYIRCILRSYVARLKLYLIASSKIPLFSEAIMSSERFPRFI